jgi:tetratricopeptide (TPR) repeat protein
MKLYHLKDFNHHPAWLIFRVDVQIKDQPVDIYLVLDLPADIILCHELVEFELSQAQADELLKRATLRKGKCPPRVLLARGDPAADVFKQSLELLAIQLELVPAPYLEELVSPLKKSFGSQFYSPSSWGYMDVKQGTDPHAPEELKGMVPDSYDLCSCNSGKKYKFCCKKILLEITQAMNAAETGNLSEALQWIAKAKAIVGETAEVLCRESIVYSFFDAAKSEALLNQCLEINPNHPRAHYLRGINLRERGDLSGAMAAYQTAIAHYPASDYYHLSEAYNNLGTVFYALGDLARAKSAWEQALLYMPLDPVTQENLKLIYKTITPGGIKKI